MDAYLEHTLNSVLCVSLYFWDYLVGQEQTQRVRCMTGWRRVGRRSNFLDPTQPDPFYAHLSCFAISCRILQLVHQMTFQVRYQYHVS